MRRPVLCILALLTACAGTGNAAEPQPAVAEPLAPAALTTHTPSPVVPVGPVTSRYSNLQIRVADVVASSNAVRGLVIDGGGEVTNMSSSPGNASLNASMPPDALDRFRHALARLPGDVESESSSSSDMTPNVQQLTERLAKLERAEVELDRIMRSSGDRAVFDALLTQRELSTRERDSLHMQIASFVQQASHAQVSITFVGPANTGRPGGEPMHAMIE